jgi:hypothetical protein
LACRWYHKRFRIETLCLDAAAGVFCATAGGKWRLTYGKYKRHFCPALPRALSWSLRQPTRRRSPLACWRRYKTAPDASGLSPM